MSVVGTTISIRPPGQRVTISSDDIVFANLTEQRTGVKSGRLTVTPEVSISVYDINTRPQSFMTPRQARSSADSHLPLTPATFHILLSLSDGERHGYAIMTEVAERTHGKVKLGPGTLYTSLKRLGETGGVEGTGEHRSHGDGAARRHYQP